MDTASPPPPPPPLLLPPGNLAPNTRPAPRPLHAAIPFNTCRPIQETNPPPDALDDVQGEEEGQEESEEKYHPVQETDPDPQALNNTQVTEQQDEQDAHTDLAGEDQLS